MTSISSVNTIDGNLMANALTNNSSSADPTGSTGQTGSTDATGATTGTGSSTSASADSGLAALSDPTTFLKLLMTELENQDPNNPMSDSDLMNQTAELTQVEAIDSLSTNITAESAAAANQSATGMLGMYVTASDAGGNPVTGQVTSVSLSPTGAPSLNVGTSTVTLSSVTQVSIVPPTP